MGENKIVDLSAAGIVDIPKPFALVICEKPAAAQRIAHALGTSSLKSISDSEIRDDNKTTRISSPFFFATDKKGQHFVICYALGHLYGLTDVGGNRSLYPVFDIQWVPIKKKAVEIIWICCLKKLKKL